MIKVILFSILTVFYAQTPETCSQKEACSYKPLTLESALAKTTEKNNINKTTVNEKKSIADFDIITITKPAQEPDNKSAKKNFENPQYLFIWIAILTGLYFYFRDKKRKSRK